jgi:hypothetical protein
MPGFGLKSEVITLAGATAQAMGSGLVPSDMVVLADTANSNPIYIGGSDVTTSNGMLVPEGTPIKLSALLSGGHYESYNLAKIFVIGSTGEKLRILYAKRDESAV